MNMMVFASMILGVFGLVTTASAQWYHQTLELVNEMDQSDKITVSVDFEVKRRKGTIEEATPVHVNVWKQSGYAAGGQAIIRTLVFNNYVIRFDSLITREYEYFLNFKAEQTIELRAAGAYLTGEAFEPVYLVGKEDTGYSKYFPQALQEIAVVIDGVWYKGYNGFDARFSMFKFYLDARN